jgi:hypothetical protein
MQRISLKFGIHCIMLSLHLVVLYFAVPYFGVPEDE